MAVSEATLKLLKSLYWIGLTFAHLFIVYLLLVSDRSITAIIWLIVGFILIYVMYWVYFPAGDPAATWPPYIRSCPDYLTTLEPGKCVDYVGVGSPILKKSNPANPPSPSDPNFVFDATGNHQQKADKANRYGLSWEGIN